MTAAGESIEQAATSVTTYVVLKQTEGGAWDRVGEFSGRDSATALRAAVDKLAERDQDGTFVATPARSWRPVNVSTKVERTLVVEDA